MILIAGCATWGGTTPCLLMTEISPVPGAKAAPPRPDWLPLLQHLAGEVPNGTVWKNVEAGLNGSGDVDYAAPTTDWATIESAFLKWAGTQGLGPVVACRHVPDALFLIALDRSKGAFAQLDVRGRATFRGSRIFHPEDLRTLSQRDERGFRRLRPGAEGLIKLVLNGVAAGGRPKPRGLGKEGVGALLGGDPDGARLAARLFGLARPAAAAGAAAAATGVWDRRAMVLVELRALALTPLNPDIVWKRLAARRVKRTCPVLVAGIDHGRCIPGDLDAWVAEVALDHAVHHPLANKAERE